MTIKTCFVFPSRPPSRGTFSEIEQSYRRASGGIEGMSVHTLTELSIVRKNVWQDPDTTIIFVREIPETIPSGRRARCVFHYTESVGEPGKLYLHQLNLLNYYAGRAGEFDLFLAGTPTAVDFWRSRCRRVGLAPLGYDPEVMGIPDWTRPKTHDIGFCGSLVGRRTWVIPAIRDRLGPRYLEIGGVSGKVRNAIFDSCRSMLHVGHSDEPSFAHLRLWSAVSTSAALVTEERDAWPAVANTHYVSLHPAEEGQPGPFVDQLEETLNLPLQEFARAMNRDLSLYTAERCIREFVLPAIKEIA